MVYNSDAAKWIAIVMVATCSFCVFDSLTDHFCWEHLAYITHFGEKLLVSLFLVSMCVPLFYLRFSATNILKFFFDRKICLDCVFAFTTVE